MQSTETWLPVVGAEGHYEVSDLGSVRSVERVIQRKNGHPQAIHQRILKQTITAEGYFVVNVGTPGNRRLNLVHRLVAIAFLGEGEAGDEVCHGDGVPAHNFLSNLRWGTRSDNMQDALMHGTHTNASKQFCTRGHEFTPTNTRLAKTKKMRQCIMCRKRREDCPLCGEERSYYGMKSHLFHAHHMTIGTKSWQTAFPSIYRN